MTDFPSSTGIIEAQARELLALEYERGGSDGPYPTYAAAARRSDGAFTLCSIRAVEAALRLNGAAQGVGDCGVRDALIAAQVALADGGIERTPFVHQAMQKIDAALAATPAQQPIKPATEEELFTLAAAAWEAQTSHPWFTDALWAAVNAVRERLTTPLSSTAPGGAA